MGKAPFPGMPPNKHLLRRACTFGPRQADTVMIPFLGHECKRARRHRRQRQTTDARLPSGVVWLKITVGAPWPVRYVTVDTSGNFIVCGQRCLVSKTLSCKQNQNTSLCALDAASPAALPHGPTTRAHNQRLPLLSRQQLPSPLKPCTCLSEAMASSLS